MYWFLETGCHFQDQNWAPLPSGRSEKFYRGWQRRDRSLWQGGNVYRYLLNVNEEPEQMSCWTVVRVIAKKARPWKAHHTHHTAKWQKFWSGQSDFREGTGHPSHTFKTMHAPVLQIWQPVYVRLQSTSSSLKEQLTEKIEFINFLLTRILLQSKMKSLAQNTCNLALTLKGAGCNILWHLGEVADCN